MTNQTEHTRLSRRAIRASVAAAPVAAVLPITASVADDEDGELIRLGTAWHAILRRADSDRIDDATRNRLIKQINGLEDAITATPARTLRGVVVKLELLRAPYNNVDDEVLDILESAMADLNRMAEGAGQTATEA